MRVWSEKLKQVRSKEREREREREIERERKETERKQRVCGNKRIQDEVNKKKPTRCIM